MEAASIGTRARAESSSSAPWGEKQFHWLQSAALINSFQVGQPKDLGSSQCYYSSVFLMNV